MQLISKIKLINWTLIEKKIKFADDRKIERVNLLFSLHSLRERHQRILLAFAFRANKHQKVLMPQNAKTVAARRVEAKEKVQERRRVRSDYSAELSIRAAYNSLRSYSRCLSGRCF